MTSTDRTAFTDRTATAAPRTLAPLALCATLAALCAPRLARAQPSPAPSPSLPPTSEAEHLVPPQGSATDVPVHAGAVCVLSFPDKLDPKAIASSADFEIQSWGTDGIAVRAINGHAAPSTLALATASGLIKVNATLRVVPATEPALTLVRFKAASAAEAFDAHVRAGVAKALAPLERELAQQRQALAKQQHDLDAQILQYADRDTTERVLRRTEVVKLNAHAPTSSCTWSAPISRSRSRAPGTPGSPHDHPMTDR